MCENISKSLEELSATYSGIILNLNVEKLEYTTFSSIQSSHGKISDIEWYKSNMTTKRGYMFIASSPDNKRMIYFKPNAGTISNEDKLKLKVSVEELWSVRTSPRLPSVPSDQIITACCICFEGIRKGDITVLLCGHCLCGGCIKELISKSGSCPICKKVPTGSLKVYFPV